MSTPPPDSPNLKVRVDLASAVPHYEQLRAQLAALITADVLRYGDRLPTVRTLASDLGIAPGTVAHAYRDLETAGMVTTRRRVGTLVTGRVRAPGAASVREGAFRLVALARAQGMSDQEIGDLVQSALLSDVVAPR